MDLEVTLDIIDYEVLFSNSVELTIHESESITFECEVGLYANSTSDYVNASMPAMAGFARESAGAYGAVYATMPAMTASIEGGFYVPPAIQYVFGVMPAMTAFVSLGTESSISIDADMPAMMGRAYESAYGEVSTTLPMMQVLAYEDPTPGELWVISKVFAMDGYHTPIQHIIFLNSTGQITSTFSGTIIQILTILEQLQASGTSTLLGTYILSMTSSLIASGDMSQIVGIVVDGTTSYTPALNEDGRVWVVNIDTGASSQYDDFGFNSFFTDETTGIDYGVADDGIYELGSSTDQDAAIEYLLEVGKSNYGSHRQKKSYAVYVGARLNGDTFLKVDIDGIEKVYSVGNTASMQPTRVGLSHRHTGTYWNLTLVGNDCNISDIEFKLLPRGRRTSD